MKALRLSSWICVLLLSLAVAAPAAAITQTDLKALIFYVQQGDDVRTQAELRRLRAAFPDWTPPADLNDLVTGAPTAETDAIWREIQQGDVAGATAAIAKVSAAYPVWTVPEDMQRLLKTTAAQNDFDAAVAAGDLSRTVQTARAAPEIIVCDRVNNPWSLADLQAGSGDTAAALRTYSGVLKACDDAHVLQATLEKANAIAGTEDMSDLFAIAIAAHPAAADTLTGLQARLDAGRGVGAANPTSGGGADIRPKSRRATGNGTPPARVVAASSDPAPPADSTSGAGGGPLAAIRAAAKQGDWAGCLALAGRSGAVAVIYERAWCAYNLARKKEALADFSIAANALSGQAARDARFGMILCYLSLNMTEQASQLAAATNLDHGQRVQVESGILDQRAVRSYKRGKFAETVAYLDALQALSGGLRRDLALLRGYSYLRMGDRQRARQEFATLDNALSTRETRAALRNAQN